MAKARSPVGLGILANILAIASKLYNIPPCALALLGITLAAKGLKAQFALAANRNRTQFTPTQLA